MGAVLSIVWRLVRLVIRVVLLITLIALIANYSSRLTRQHFPYVSQWVWVSGGMAVGLWAYVYFLGRYAHLLVADQLDGVRVLRYGLSDPNR